MSLCEACRKALPYIPASGGDEDSIAATSKVLSEHGDWKRWPVPGSVESWYLTHPFSLHKSWESLVISLSRDCPICWTLWPNVRSSPISTPSNEAIPGFIAEITRLECYPDRPQYCVGISLIGHHLETKELSFWIWKTTEKCYQGAEREFSLAVQHTPKSAADAARHWIENCEAKHPECLKQAAPPDNAKMPTRLLDLGDENSNTWRLYQDPGHVPYAALSHRLSSETPELHSSNHAAYCSPQPDSFLPQNYQDIISICRAIPIRYLWIDSLCIIQNDNGHEFQKEAPLMRDIYQYAFLTLSICWDFHGHSIFRRCQPRSIPRPRPLACYGEHDCGAVPDELVFAEVKEPMELPVHVSGAPINKRAWVLQERCLSRRLLYLGNDQLYWECDGCTGSEASPYKIEKYGGRHSILDLTGPYKDRAWSWTLTQYTRSDLTFESDRLIAIAGLAKLIASKTGGTYFAGIWLDTWMQDLLWEPIKERDRRSELKPGELAMAPPSWSWLGFSGSVYSGIIMSGEGPRISTVSPNSFKSDAYQPLALLNQAIVIPPTSDPFTFFERATLKIRCLLVPVTFAGIPHKDEQPWGFRHEHDVELPSVGLDCFRLQACKLFDDRFNTIRFYFSKPLDMSLQYFLLPLYICQETESMPHPPCTYGLVLQRGLHKGNEEYTRIGTWHGNLISSSSQLIPIISNTIVNIGVGVNLTVSDGSLTENERVFDLKLGEYAAGQADSKVQLPMKIVKKAVGYQPDIEEVDEKAAISGSGATAPEVKGTEEEEEDPFIRNEKVGCSLLPHFTTAEWGTISLV